MLPPAKAKKYTACEACFHSRQRCYRKPGSVECERCIQKGRLCQKRTVKKKVSSSPQRFHFQKYVRNGINWSQVADAFDNLVTASHDREKVQQLEKSCNTIVLSTKQPITNIVVTYLASRAFRTSYLPYLHACTTLGLKSGCKENILHSRESKMPACDKYRIVEKFKQEWFLNNQSFNTKYSLETSGGGNSATYFTTTIEGTETTIANHNFQNYFEIEHVKHKFEHPAYTGWRHIIVNNDVCQMIKSRVIEHFCHSYVHTSIFEYKATQFIYNSQIDFKKGILLKDKHGKKFHGNLIIKCVIISPENLWITSTEITGLEITNQEEALQNNNNDDDLKNNNTKEQMEIPVFDSVTSDALTYDSELYELLNDLF